MRKWRPSNKNIYVIPAVLGNLNSLLLIFNTILPLRFSEGNDDKIIMLGNYINGCDKSFQTIECLINIKKEYGDRIILLRGKSEELLLRSLSNSKDDYNAWINSGGVETLSSYIKYNNINSSPNSIPITRLQDIINKEHIDFLKEMPAKFIYENYVLMCGGFDINKTIEENADNNFIFDYTSSRYVKECYKINKGPQFKDNYIFVSHNNYNSKEPYLSQNYFMLGETAPTKLIAFELNSMSAIACNIEKKKTYKYEFKYVE